MTDLSAEDRARLRAELKDIVGGGFPVPVMKLRALLDAADERDRLLAGRAARTMDFTYDTLRAAAEQAREQLQELSYDFDIDRSALAALDAALEDGK